MGLPDRLWTAISESLFGDGDGRGTAGTESARQRAQGSALVVWLLGKTGANSYLIRQ